MILSINILLSAVVAFIPLYLDLSSLVLLVAHCNGCEVGRLFTAVSSHSEATNDFNTEIITLTGTKQKIVNLPLLLDDPVQRQPDISKAK